jgi:hypothetical protein
MGLVAIWFLFGIVAAVVASRKGRGGCSWFALGFLLGPFGLILALVVGPNQQAVEQRALESGTMKKCPQCAELVRLDAIRCRFCGAELPPPEVEEEGSEQTVGCRLGQFVGKGRMRPGTEITEGAASERSHRHRCPACGQPYSPGDYDPRAASIFCPHCHGELPR